MIRAVTPADVPRVLTLVRELAEYERAPHAVRATESEYSAALFAPDAKVFCTVAEADGNVVGFALWYVTFSSWLGRHGIWLDDLYVQPAHRGIGLGRELLLHLVGIARDRGYGRVEWWVLDWNEPAQRFYRSLGAEPQDDWTVWRLDPAAPASP